MFSQEDILSEFCEARYMGRNQLERSYEELMDRRKLEVMAYHREYTANWILRPGNWLKKSVYMKSYNRRPEVRSREKLRPRNCTWQNMRRVTRHKLTQKTADEIRRLYTGKYGELVRFAKVYKVSASCISDVVHKRKWMFK